MTTLLRAILLLSLVAWIMSGIVFVAPHERAVVRRFGRALPPLPPGAHWLMPRGIDRVDRVAVDRVRSTPIGYLELDDSAQVPPGQMVTGDHNLVHVRVLAQWRVDPARVVDFALAGTTIEAVMTQTLEGVLGEWAGARQVDSILLEGKQRLADEVLTEARARLKAQDLGIDLLDLRPELLAPPEEVKPAFAAVARAETGRQTLLMRTEQECETRRRTAQADIYRMEQDAKLAAETVKRMAKTDAQRFLARLDGYNRSGRTVSYLRQIWEDERGRVFTKLRQSGKLGLLDHHLGPDGLDIQSAPLAPSAR
jgi:regulator of protease activity HflC (stomatin/prohibitin superfamily)